MFEFQQARVTKPAYTLVSIALVTCFATLTYADTTTSPPNWPVVDDKTNLTQDPATRVVFGKFELILEKTTLEELRTAIGSGKITHQGDASESLTWLCYTLASPTMQRIWLSSSELGGGSVIDGISALEIDSAKTAIAECPTLPEKFQPVHLLNQTWIGSSEKVILQQLGKQNKSSTIWTYIYNGKEGEFSVTSMVVIHLQAGKAMAIDISHSTSD